MHILASDFDNTLYFKSGFKEDDLKAIKKFQEAGHQFGLCTGRNLNGVLAPSSNVDIRYDFYILLSGGLILDRNHTVIFEKKIPFSIIREVYRLFPINLSISAMDKMYLLYDKDTEKEWKNRQNKVARSGSQKEQLIFIHSLDELEFEEVNGFSLHYNEGELEQAKACTETINNLFSESLAAFQNNVHIDITSVGCSKGHGLEMIQNYYNHHYINGIGDSWNDLPMLVNASQSFTFDYAPDDVKKQSHHIVSQLSECIDYLMK